MTTIMKDSPQYNLLIRLVSSVGRETRMNDQDKVLMMLLLDTDEKVQEFARWIVSKSEGERITATAKEVIQKVSEISRMETLDL